MNINFYMDNPLLFYEIDRHDLENDFSLESTLISLGILLSLLIVNVIFILYEKRRMILYNEQIVKTKYPLKNISICYCPNNIISIAIKEY